jgi:hypothetical protein
VRLEKYKISGVSCRKWHIFQRFTLSRCFHLIYLVHTLYTLAAAIVISAPRDILSPKRHFISQRQQTEFGERE